MNFKSKPGLKAEDLFHRVLKQARLRSPQEVWGVCVSGGLDSMVLLRVLKQVSRVTGHSIWAFHVHHGLAADLKQTAYRDEAQELVEKTCAELEVPLRIGRVEKVFERSPNEAVLRELRWAQLQKVIKAEPFFESKPLVFVTGHHLDDVLETRLLHLIRGTSGRGLSEFRASSPGIWRPLFHLSKQELHDLAVRQAWTWREDHSNEDTGPLRNWVRKVWLPALEQKRAGSRSSLHRSLDNLVEDLALAASSDSDTLSLNENELSRVTYESLSRQRQFQVLAQLIRQQCPQGYTKGQIEEVAKRLSSSQSEFQFRVSKLLWKVNRATITASRV